MLDFNSHILPLSIFASYFLTIIGLFLLIFWDLYLLAQKSSAPRLERAIFATLTIASFAHTWFYMFEYMAWSFADHGRALPPQDLLTQIASWLHDTALFEQAWSIVCFNPLNWWWSEQLCLFAVGTWTVFLAKEGPWVPIKHLWAYMLLGQIVAISVASNLFYLAVLLAFHLQIERVQNKPRLSPKVWLSVFASLATVAATPYTSKQTFLPNLLLMHALLFIPLVSKNIYSRSRYSMDTGTLFNLVYIASAAIRIKTLLTTLKHLNATDSFSPLQMAHTAWKVLHSHPAQASIGWDVIWTSISFTIWIATQDSGYGRLSKRLSILYLTLATPLASIGVTAPYILQPRREKLKSKSNVDKNE